MCPPKGMRCPSKHKSICPHYCTFREDFVIHTVRFFSFSRVNVFCCYIAGYLSAVSSDLFQIKYCKSINDSEQTLGNITKYAKQIDCCAYCSTCRVNCVSTKYYLPLQSYSVGISILYRAFVS